MLESLLELSTVFEKEPAVFTGNLENLLFVGDIHGDLETVDIIEGSLNKYDRIICLGDYVDRGEKDIDVVKKLSKLKIDNKDKLVLLPGNHDVDSEVYPRDFLVRLIDNVDSPIKTIRAYENAFKKAPIAYHNERYSILAVHGFIPYGIGNDFKKWEKVESGDKEIFDQILWNDPMLFSNITGDNPRGKGIKSVGKSDTLNFMKNNNLKIIIRSHEPQINEIYDIKNKKVVNIGSSMVYDVRKFYVLPKGKIVDNP